MTEPSKNSENREHDEHSSQMEHSSNNEHSNQPLSQKFKQMASQPTTHKVPDQVVGASQAWLLTSALQAVLAIASSITYWLNPAATIALLGADEALKDIPQDSQNTVFNVAIVIGLIFALIVCGLFAVMARRILKGALGARLILSIGTIYLVFQAIAVFFGSLSAPLADAPTWLAFIIGAAQIASAVAASAGVVLASTKDATRFFEDKNPKLFNKDK